MQQNQQWPQMAIHGRREIICSGYINCLDGSVNREPLRRSRTVKYFVPNHSFEVSVDRPEVRCPSSGSFSATSIKFPESELIEVYCGIE
jgi:hypothetical protein